MSESNYKPSVPRWVGDILLKQKNQDPFATLGETKRWDEWKHRYSRKLKYARLNGWTIDEE
ncbi:hypothetical protein [Bacillus subtilis]|uniref:hypothetical protein n=1 Tax=Bacillus subtilis TaxID=1423 RepID=UPI000EF23829|nr:hypothetical protein [Bacillus subtilis]AYK63152.1 hypothetical protein D9C14_18135 [Bacillus subtilis subsp. subtilis]MBU8716509.1 hypothetical protein [Bacillus subtilis]CAF1917157.1 hypothetical protein NRS6206_03974 [Bacillus subtilis]